MWVFHSKQWHFKGNIFFASLQVKYSTLQMQGDVWKLINTMKMNKYQAVVPI